MQGEDVVGGQGVAQAPVAHHVTFVPVDLKVNVFTGMKLSPNDPSVEEWVADMVSMMKAWNTPQDQQPQMLLKYLSGEAKRVVQVMAAADQRNGQTILNRLLEVYGDKTPTTTLLQRFHSRRQGDGESEREFSLALQEIAGKIRKRDPESFPKPDEMLRDHFVQGLRNKDILRALKSNLRGRPEASFEDVHSEALHQMTDYEESIGVHAVNVAPVQSPSLMTTLQTTLEETVKQQREMAQMMAAMRMELNQLHFGASSYNYTRPPRRQPRWDEQGNPICFKCDKPGHMARECPQRRPAQSN